MFRFFPKTHTITLATLIIVSIIVFIGKPSEEAPSTKTLRPFKAASEGTEATNQSEPASAPTEEITPIPPSEPILKWESTTVQSGDNLSALFARNQLSALDALNIAKVSRDGSQMKPGQTVRWAKHVQNDNEELKEIEIELSALKKHRFLRNENGTFDYELIERTPERQPKFAQATINSSLFQDGGSAQIPYKVLVQLAAIFGWDVDFALDIRKGDHFELIYDELFLDGEKMGAGNILVARFTNKGKQYTAIRYEDQKNNAQYYTPKGLSMRKEFLRNPIDFARISSRFSLGRKHPILNRIRAHKGTDYAAAIGTPIKAAGDGRVIFSGRKGGYGNVVIIKHSSRYETRYAHLHKFNRKAKRGMTVKQGQVIGYVGMTGLATGPHLHYEFRVDGIHRDSLKIKLPKSRAVSKSNKSDFLEHANNVTHLLDQYQANWQ